MARSAPACVPIHPLVPATGLFWRPLWRALRSFLKHFRKAVCDTINPRSPLSARSIAFLQKNDQPLACAPSCRVLCLSVQTIILDGQLSNEATRAALVDSRGQAGDASGA